MSYRHTIEAALESLHEIEDLIKGFPTGGNIPSIELDLALQKIRNMYELMLVMKVNTLSAAEGKEVIAVSANTSKVTDEVVVKESTVVEQKTVQEEVKKTVEVVASRKTKENEVQTLADQFKGHTTLHESLHKTLKNDKSDPHVTPVSDLLKAIAINDRFTLTRELFDNNTQLFESTMRTLNDAANFNEAYNFMTQYFNWDMDSEPVQMLLDMIRRKFIKSRNE